MNGPHGFCLHCIEYRVGALVFDHNASHLLAQYRNKRATLPPCNGRKSNARAAEDFDAYWAHRSAL